MDKQQLKIDPEFHALIPPLIDEEREQLEKNIKKEGCRDSLVLWGNIILDGHNRYEICRRLKIKFRTTRIKLSCREDAAEWIDKNQIGRRNLTPDQLRLLRGRRYNRAKRQDLGHGDQKSGYKNYTPNTASRLAAEYGVSPLTIKNDGKFAEEAEHDPEIKIAIRERKPVSKVKKQRNIRIRRKRLIDEMKAAIIERPIIYHADCMEYLGKVQPIDLLLTDPPYFTEGDFTGSVSEYLKNVKETGQAYVFSSADPAEIKAYLSMDSHHMVLSQILVWNYNNTGQRQPNDRYNSNYQLIFYYRGPQARDINKPGDGTHQYACQTINAPDGRIGDRFHEWQKPIDLIEILIRNSSCEGDYIFDPFAGTGTTILAAAKLGRKAGGCEIEKSNINICIERGCILEP